MATLVLAMAAGAGALPVVASPPVPRQPGIAVRVRTVTNRGCEVSRGMSAQDVLPCLGAPGANLSPSVWVYSGYHAVEKHAETTQCTQLLVTVTASVVTDLHFISERAQVIIAAREHVAR